MPEAAVWIPETESEREAIRKQLELVLADPLFSHSKRYPSLLRFVVEWTLAGQTEKLKERTLGVEVFGRDSDYDTNVDPVVRTTAVEIRKRIATYYQGPGREFEIRIDLPAGSYVPEFRKAAEAQPAEPGPEPEIVSERRPWTRRLIAAVAAIATVAAIVTWLHPWVSQSALERFWRPVMASRGTVLFCIGGPRGESLGVPSRQGADPNGSQQVAELPAWQAVRTEYVALADTITLSSVAGILQARGKSYQIRGHAVTSFADLRNVPVILIGAFNNPWTLRFTDAMRYTFVLERGLGPDGKTEVIDWIRDRQNPSKKEWTLNTDLPYTKVTEDYAIISRTFDANTQGVMVIVGGLLKWGTVAAGEFLSDPKYMEEVARQAPANWEHRNLQIVIGTKVFNGNSGPPRVLATHFW